MTFLGRIKKLVSYLSIFAMISLQIAPVQAAMVSNEDLLIQAQHDISLEQIITMLDHEEIQKKLTAMGVNPSAAKIRVSQMNDSELAKLTQSLEESPAGSGALGMLLTIFIVLVITDMLGATDVFPFVKNINK